MTIEAFFTPYFLEKEKQFDSSVVVMIDVLRASTTICAALFNGAKEVIPAETLDKAVTIYSNLDKNVRFLGGEREGVKPSGFNAGNSPFEFTEEKVSKKNVVLTTSNGTKIFRKAREAKAQIIGAFVNQTAVLEYLKEYHLKDEHTDKNLKIYFLCAGTDGKFSYEDALCAGAFIKELKKEYAEAVLTDSADAVKNLYNLHSEDLVEFLRTKEHAAFLREIGFSEDVELALTRDQFPVVPVIDGSSIKRFSKS